MPVIKEGDGFEARAPGWRAAAAARRLKGLPRHEQTGKIVDPRMLRADAIAYLSHNAELSDAAHRLATVLLDHLTDLKLGTGQSTVSLTNAKLIARTGWSERKLQRVFAELEAAGLVDRYTNAAHRRAGADAPDLVGLFQVSHGFRKTLGQRAAKKIHKPVTADDLLREVTQYQESESTDSPGGAARRSAIAQDKFIIEDLCRAIGCKPNARALVEFALAMTPERDRLADIIWSVVRKRRWEETLPRIALALVWMRAGVKSAMGVAIHCLKTPDPDYRRLREAVQATMQVEEPSKKGTVVLMRFPMTGSLEYATGAERLMTIARNHAPGLCPDMMAGVFRQYLIDKGRGDATGADLERMWTAFVKGYAARRGISA